MVGDRRIRKLPLHSQPRWAHRTTGLRSQRPPYSEDDLDELAADLSAFIDIPDGANAEYFRSDAVRDKIDAYNEACSDGDETVTLDVFEQV